MAITWQVEIDWDGDGSFAYDECARVTKLRIERGRRDEFEAFTAGKAVLTLDNHDRRFDPWYMESPLYGRVLPRRGLRVSAVVNIETLVLFTGRIEEIEPAGHVGDRTVLITAYDGLRDLAATDVPMVALQTGVRTDEAITAVLDAAGWPAGDRDLDAGNDTLGYFWTAGGEQANKIIDELARSEFGAFFVDVSGKVRFINRQSYYTAEPVGMLDQADMADVQLRQPWEAVYNTVTVRCKPVVAGSVMALWQLQDAGVYLDPGESVELWAEYLDSTGAACSGRNMVTPVATTDYTANTVQGGGGTDMTASMSVTGNIYSSWAKLTVTNTHGSLGLYITLLKIRGEPLSQTPTPIRRDDASSL